MELIATTRPEAVAVAYGASISPDGRYVRCELLLVRAGTTRRTVTLRVPGTNTRYRVRLPAPALGRKGGARFLRESLEIL